MHITSHHAVQQVEGPGVLVSGFKLITVAFRTILHRIYPAPSLHSWHTWLYLPPAGEVTARKMSGPGHLLNSVFTRLPCQYFIGQMLAGEFVWVCSPSWIGCLGAPKLSSLLSVLLGLLSVLSELKRLALPCSFFLKKRMQLTVFCNRHRSSFPLPSRGFSRFSFSAFLLCFSSVSFSEKAVLCYSYCILARSGSHICF